MPKYRDYNWPRLSAMQPGEYFAKSIGTATNIPEMTIPRPPATGAIPRPPISAAAAPMPVPLTQGETGEAKTPAQKRYEANRDRMLFAGPREAYDAELKAQEAKSEQASQEELQHKRQLELTGQRYIRPAEVKAEGQAMVADRKAQASQEVQRLKGEQEALKTKLQSETSLKQQESANKTRLQIAGLEMEQKLAELELTGRVVGSPEYNRVVTDKMKSDVQRGIIRTQGDLANTVLTVMGKIQANEWDTAEEKAVAAQNILSEYSNLARQMESDTEPPVNPMDAPDGIRDGATFASVDINQDGRLSPEETEYDELAKALETEASPARQEKIKAAMRLIKDAMLKTM